MSDRNVASTTEMFFLPYIFPHRLWTSADQVRRPWRPSCRFHAYGPTHASDVVRGPVSTLLTGGHVPHRRPLGLSLPRVQTFSKIPRHFPTLWTEIDVYRYLIFFYQKLFLLFYSVIEALAGLRMGHGITFAELPEERDNAR